MRDPSQHILFVATEYESGMRPYASAIIHTMWQQGDHVLIVYKRDDYLHDFDDLPADSITWISYPVTKISKACFRLHPTRVIQAIEQLIEGNHISLVYSLTEELVLASSVTRLQRLCPLLYTVHDAIHHDVKFNSLIAWAKDRLLMVIPQRRMLQRCRHIITNSHEQLKLIERNHPDHDVHYAPFPTLVNDDILNGNTQVPELEGIDDGYILFFGNLHLYKGVHLLYDTYLSHPELRRLPLVIAGSGYIYFEHNSDEQNVIFINRFINDSEVGDLFSRAAVVVYPYISATQSGVTSIASYYGKPMVLSDLPFFKQTCEGCEGIHFFLTGNRESLAAAINRALHSPDTSTRRLYDRVYSVQALRTALSEVIARV